MGGTVIGMGGSGGTVLFIVRDLIIEKKWGSATRVLGGGRI